MTPMSFEEFKQLQAENRRLRRENEELQGKVKGLERQKENVIEGYRLLEWTKNQLHDQLVAMQDKESDQYWAWQPDFEENHLESLSCPVLIPAAWLRELLEDRDEKIKILENALQFDKAGLAGALASVVAEVNARRWILEGRGPYTHDDKAYQREAGLAFDSIEEIGTGALNRSGLLVVAARYALSTHDKNVRAGGGDSENV